MKKIEFNNKFQFSGFCLTSLISSMFNIAILVAGISSPWPLNQSLAASVALI